MNESKKNEIKLVISACIRNKLKNYKAESSHMPFHYRLLGKDRMALFSFIHSLNTTFGTSIFEPAAIALAKDKFTKAEAQVSLGTEISSEAQRVIQEIINNLSYENNLSNKLREIELIREVCQKGNMLKLKTVKVDIFLEDENYAYFIDLKTVKPNLSNFKDYKRTLLEWIAIYLAFNPIAQVASYIAIPYNPYEPKPYDRWTMKGMLDIENELIVADELWNFLGKDENSYENLLTCFEEAGRELRQEIDEYFARFNETQTHNLTALVTKELFPKDN